MVDLLSLTKLYDKKGLNVKLDRGRKNIATPSERRENQYTRRR
jgi:hypothetical protein